MKYQKLSPEEQTSRGILGRLVGIIADFKNPTRNGRHYTEELWDKTFNDPIMKEKIENRCLFGELGHPTDRQEIDMEKIAICMAEVPKKGNDGKLYGVFDILNTPLGCILKTLCDYGCKIGVSSRGCGDTFSDYNGQETVDPETYECECWDAVLLPAVKEARPTYVTESWAPSKTKTFKQALQEALETSSEKDRKTMEASLEELDIDYKDENVSSENEDNLPEEVDIDTVTTPESDAAENSGANLMEELQTSLKTQQDLEKQVASLQKKLSVCYTKEARYSNVLLGTKDQLTEALAENQRLKDSIKSLNEKLVASATESTEKDQLILKLRKRVREGNDEHRVMNEQLLSNASQIQSFQKQVKSLNEKYSDQISDLNKQNMTLNEELQERSKDLQICKSQASARITKANQLVERYKSIAKTAVDKYIFLQATRLGISASDIKSKLNENYSFADIDHVCSELQRYKLNVNSLPFNVSKDKPVKMKISESKEVIYPGYHDDLVDDEIDNTLGSFIN